ncbi:unnamed protein product [Fusarium venenatum]|uniref:Uncharacterized protein n=1 Tax=Fusarium venenatum TaxID=56646 RepID=A0A2L2T913_9HYPO|nr:uncharacterized protein FVRRES_06177 [Fusarium venenatum]CEI61741.1 unnamed protein product [Fusarium venenatum]
MPRLLIDSEQGSTIQRQKNRTKNKRRRRRQNRQPNTEHAAGIFRFTLNVQEVEPHQLLTENDVFVDLENLDGDSIAHYFMTKDDTDPKLEGQAKTVVLFCHPDALSELQSGSSKLLPEKVCLIDDRTCQGLTSNALGVCKPLSVYDMFKKLQEKVSDI